MAWSPFCGLTCRRLVATGRMRRDMVATLEGLAQESQDALSNAGIPGSTPYSRYREAECTRLRNPTGVVCARYTLRRYIEHAHPPS